jgi:hypothetical protein
MINLLLPSANHLGAEMQDKHLYVINPTATSTYDLDLFQFLGVIMGVSVRTGAYLSLDLPNMVWKRLVG